MEVVFQGLVAYGFGWLQCIKVKPCSQQGSQVKIQLHTTLCSKRYHKNIATTVTSVHALNCVLSSVSCTASQAASLLCVEYSAGQAPVLDADF